MNNQFSAFVAAIAQVVAQVVAEPVVCPNADATCHLFFIVFCGIYSQILFLIIRC